MHRTSGQTKPLACFSCMRIQIDEQVLLEGSCPVTSALCALIRHRCSNMHRKTACACWKQVRFKPPLSAREAAFLQELQIERLF